MKFTIDWLKEHLETKATDTEIINKLTAIGLEVEEVIDAAALYGDFITVSYTHLTLPTILRV